MRKRTGHSEVGKDDHQCGRLHDEYFGKGSMDEALSLGVRIVEANLEQPKQS